MYARRLTASRQAKSHERLEVDSAGGLAMRLLVRVPLDKLHNIMISYAGECHSNRGGSEIIEREMMMMVAAANDIMVCVIRYDTRHEPIRVTWWGR